jgi:hypothetical protein
VVLASPPVGETGERVDVHGPRLGWQGERDLTLIRAVIGVVNWKPDTYFLPKLGYISSRRRQNLDTDTKVQCDTDPSADKHGKIQKNL